MLVRDGPMDVRAAIMPWAEARSLTEVRQENQASAGRNPSRRLLAMVLFVRRSNLQLDVGAEALGRL